MDSAATGKPEALLVILQQTCLQVLAEGGGNAAEDMKSANSRERTATGIDSDSKSHGCYATRNARSLYTCPSYENTLPRHTSQRCAGQYHGKKFNIVTRFKKKIKKMGGGGGGRGGRPYKNVQYIKSPLEHSLSNDFDVYLQSHCGICLAV